MKNDTIIVGAGLAGLLAAHAWPTARIIEAAPSPNASHKALMRFRSDVCAKLTGVEFRKVMVRKGIYFEGRFVQPNIEVANLYSQKVIGRLADRSIWNLDPVERFIAPEDFYDQLIASVGNRIEWNTKFTPEMAKDATVISTMPLPIMLDLCGYIMPKEQFNRSPIKVRRWRIPNADVFQTVYFPDPETSLYRASITGDLLIVEEVPSGDGEQAPLYWAERVFGIDPESLEPLDEVKQTYGKVDELPAQLRKNLLFELTASRDIYSLGRFATWRNILLDDVVEDISVIKRLIKSASAYDARKVAAGI